MDSNQQQVQHGLEPSCDLFNPQQDSGGVANAGMWKAFSCAHPDKLCSSSSTSPKAVNIMPEPPADFYRPDALLDAAEADETLVVTPDLAAWQAGRLLLDEYSSLRCLLPGAAAVEQPRQGLSLLSLCKAKGAPDTRLQQQPPFDIREGYSRQQSDLKDGLLPRTSFHGELMPHQQYSLLQESHVFFPQLGTASSSSPGLCSINAHQCLRNSQYLAPAQELLNEICCVKPPNNYNSERPNHKLSRESEEGFVPTSCAQRHRLLLSLDIIELKKRMGKLVSMLEALDRRYGKYCEQMKALTSSFEAVAGEGAARVYSALASKAMSRHFRCLRDGIVGQISETKNAIGEKDPAHAPGMTRGETPRLRLLVRYVRQQKAMFQHAGASSTAAHPWRPQRGLPERSVSVLRAWLFEHFLHPYPTDVDKHILARQTGLSRSQVCNWFINARVRLWKPMVEEMYSEEASKEMPAALQYSAQREDHDRRLPSTQSPNPNPRDVVVVTQRQLQDAYKKSAGGATTQLLDGSDADSSLSSVVGGGGHKSEVMIGGGGGGRREARFAGASRAYHDQVLLHHPQQLPGPGNNFGALDVGFPSGAGAVCSGGQQSFANSTAAVSLTLGLQQNDGAGVSFSFMPPSSQSSLLFSREAIDHNYQPMQFSILDGDTVQNPPYRNFVGAQVLHDLTG